MSEQIRLIAQRLKELREISGIPLETLASDLHIPLEDYLAYEGGETDIPVSFLYAAASKFGVELTAILTGEGPRLHTYSLVRNGKGISVERRKQYKYQSLAYNFINKNAEPFLVTVDPAASDTPFHYNTHPGQEFNYVLEGTLQVSINGHEITLQPGDSLYFDSNNHHGMKALNNEPAKFIAIIL